MPVVEITELAPGGDAVGHLDIGGERRAVFVPRGAVGDKLRVEIDARKRPARGVILEVIQPGPERVAPPCAYADRCGGCDWMHVSHAGQLAAHAAHVEAAVGLAPSVHAAEKTLRYRQRARLHAKDGVVGPHASRSRAPLAVETCAVLDPVLDRGLALARDLLRGTTGEAEVGLGVGRAGKPVLELACDAELPGPFFAQLERQPWDGARVWIEGARVPAVFGDPTPVIAGADDLPLVLAPAGFSQAHAQTNRALARHVAKLAKGRRTLELYAGSGNLTVMLARGARVRAVESDERACEAARENLRARALDAKVTCADAASESVDGASVIVLDPPRAGAKEACERIARSRAQRVIYVSCDPASLARDLAILRPRFTPVRADAFEMFPHTSHIECVVVLER